MLPSPRALSRMMALAIALSPPSVAASWQDENERDGGPPTMQDLQRQIDELRERLDASRQDDDLDALFEEGDAAAAVEESTQEAQARDALSFLPQRLNAYNPRLTVFGDMLASLSASEAEREGDDRFSLREAEVDLRADVDPYATGVLILAFEEEEPGEYEAAVEEGYVDFVGLPAGLSVRAGKFFQDFGRINQLHTHDLPFPEKPLPLQDFFGEEGLNDAAVMVDWLAPEAPLRLGASMLNGANEAILAGPDSQDFAYLGRAELFADIDQRTTLSGGGSFLWGRGETKERETRLVGADMMYKYRPDDFSSLVVQGEVYYLERELTSAGGLRSETTDYGFGSYLYLQYQPTRNWYLGARWDTSNYFEQTRDSKHWQVGVYVSYYTTEFLRLRLGYEHQEFDPDPSGPDPGPVPDQDRILLALTFVFGSHPAEPYWVNR
ncbi:MAG: hypothetical protein RL885_13015 [Planctomycetota bacterium]